MIVEEKDVHQDYLPMHLIKFIKQEYFNLTSIFLKLASQLKSIVSLLFKLDALTNYSIIAPC